MKADYARYAFFLVFAVGAGFMVVTNFIAFKVLRPPKRLGFLWWHVTAVSLTMLGFGIVTLSYASQNLGADASWRTYVTGVSILLFTISQIIVFNIERTRLLYTKAIESGEVKDAGHVG